MGAMYSRLAPLFFVFIPACAGSSAPVDAGPTPASAAPSAAAPVASAPASAAPAAPSAASVDPNLCVLDKSDAWKGCVGKIVEVHGQTPKMVNQHPMMAPVNPMGGPAPKISQSYLDMPEGRQIIIISSKPDDCDGAKRVKGSLREIDMGGPSGTKQSYHGWAIENATITCE